MFSRVTNVMEIALGLDSLMDDREASLIQERFGKSGVKQFRVNREMRDGI